VSPNLGQYSTLEPETDDTVDINKATGEKVAEGRKNFVSKLFYFYIM
jgi:hypothetical protein